MNDDLTALAARIAAGDQSPVEVLQTLLERIAAHDEQILAFECLNPDAQAQAAQCADQLARGIHRGPLHGVPIAIKDNYLTAEMPTTAGSRAPGYTFAREDSAAVARLRAAGAVLTVRLVVPPMAVMVPASVPSAKMKRMPTLTPLAPFQVVPTPVMVLPLWLAVPVR